MSEVTVINTEEPLETEIIPEEANNTSASINNTIYTHEELEIFTKSRNIRMQLVDGLMSSGVPTKVGEVRVINELLTSLDKNAQDSASNRLKYQEGQSKEAMQETIVGILKEISATKQQHVRTVDPVIPDSYIPTDVVYGESDIHPDQLDPTDFLGKED